MLLFKDIGTIFQFLCLFRMDTVDAKKAQFTPFGYILAAGRHINKEAQHF